MSYEKWENPAVIGENVLPAHCTFELENAISLNGKWRFFCAPAPEQIPEYFYEETYDVAGWDEIDVPCCWETRGYGAPYYYGAGLPPALSTSKKKIPGIDHKKTYTGAYRRTVTLPEEWKEEQIILRFNSVKSAFYCWVNGQYAGLGKGSMLPVEFDVTEMVHPGENTICVKVFSYSDATYLEDQDMWFLAGIYRDVTLYAQPKSRIQDIYAKAQFIGKAAETEESGSDTIAENTAGEKYQRAKLYVVTETHNAIGKRLSVKLLWENETAAAADCIIESDRTELAFVCEGVRLWTAETPNLYQLEVTLQDGETLEQERTIDFGFREISIDREKARLLINGRPLKLRGINYHAFTPDNGYYVPSEVYERDLQTMKRFNINAIRTSHYPQDDYFYTLCNRYGIYVMDECNVETHAVRSKNVPGDNPVWTAHVTDRMRRMVCRDRNHPCVVIWSLGNESDVGTNHYRMKEEALKLDDTRPIHYEGGSDLKLSDFLCDGYSAPEREQLFAEGKDVDKKGSVLQVLLPLNMSLDSVKFEDYKHHPIVATEYGYCMGNSGSDVEKHVQIYNDSDRWCGGFIWDFKDKSLTKEYVDGKPFQAYGGDYGVRDQKGNICCDGATDWNGVPHEGFYEIKKAFQPIVCTLQNDHMVEVENRNSFVDTSQYRCTWELSRDGKMIENGSMDIFVEPREKKSFVLPYMDPLTEPGVYYLKIQFALSDNQLWAEAGHVVAYEQWCLKESVQEERAGEVKIERDGDIIRMMTKCAVYCISAQTGDLVQIETDGKNLLKTPMRPSFFRAVTDADAGFMGLAMGKAEKTGYWGKISLQGLGKPKAVEVKEDCVLVVHKLKGANYGRSYKVTADGALAVSCVLKTGKKSAPVRFGMQMELDSSYDTFTWFGKGPHDTYWGREYSGVVEVHQKNVREQDEHVRPQEHGNKQSVRWLTLTNKDGKGVRVECIHAPIAASAWPYTLEQLQSASHVHELPDYHATTLNIDGIQNGLGDCFVPCPPCYKLQPESKYKYQFKISAI